MPSAFVVELSHLGTLLFGTYLGGSGGDANGNSIAINNSGDVYVAGDTSTSNLFPMAPQIALNPSAGFLTKFSSNLHTVQSTTFLGYTITGVVASQPRPRTAAAPIQPTTLYTTGGRYQDANNVDAFVVRLTDPAQVTFYPPVRRPIVSRLAQ
jgi:hypothetical protein